MKTIIKFQSIKSGMLFLGIVILATSCNKFLNTQLPAGTISGDNVYISDNSVASVVTGNLINIVNNSGFVAGSPGSNLGFITGLYTDELFDLSPTAGNYRQAFYKDAIQSSNTSHWTNGYAEIFDINSCIEGINNTSSPLYYKDQWLGESYFSRAFLYFNLVNLYGDIPLALTTDFKVNNNLKRSPQVQIYQQIITDLKQAQKLLSADYKDGFGATSTIRVRPNKAAATALLAKVYLYTQKWDSADIQADSIISNTAFKLAPIDQVFNASSPETIWAMALPSNSTTSAAEYGYYNQGMPAIITSNNSTSTYSVYAAISSNLLGMFESGDLRYTNWIRSSTVLASATVPAATYYFPNKYSSAALGSYNEVVLRLAELYLIRAEARAHLNDLDGAAADIDAVRTRAGLPNTNATTQATLLDAIAKERQTELFTESANRFFDLKRTNQIDAVMAQVCIQKETTWSSYMQIWPIPPADILQDPLLTQNPGYQASN